MMSERAKFWNARAPWIIDKGDHSSEEEERELTLDLEELSDVINYYQFKNILEVGCGEGRVLRRLRERYPEVNLSGIDVSDLIIQEARERSINSNIDFEVVDLRNIVEIKEKYDLVFTRTCLMHFLDDEIARAIDALLILGSKVLLVESVGDFKVDWCVSHNYPEIFKRMEKNFGWMKRNSYPVIGGYREIYLLA